ncbi:MAG TPA: lamin tail domain-containing protein, partial [Pirellulaceae bacterium]
PGADPIFGTGGFANGDWFELVNTGNSPIDMTGYLWDDNQRLAGFPNAGFTQFPNGFIIQPQEAVLVLEETIDAGAMEDPVNAPGGFRESWDLGELPRILSRDMMLGPDAFSGISSTNGDEVNIYDPTRALVASIVAPAMGAARGSSFEWDAQGVFLDRSFIGENGAYQALMDGSTNPPPYPSLDIGSPGIYVGQPATVDGDFDNDGDYDCQDVNALSTAVATGGVVATFDLNGDNSLTVGDLDAWRLEAGEDRFGTGRAYRVADANLDGVVDGSDFNIWNGSKFTSNTNWCSGNFNGDLVIDGSDFNLWNGNKFTASDSASVVPEPGVGLLAMWALGMTAFRRSPRGVSR